MGFDITKEKKILLVQYLKDIANTTQGGTGLCRYVDVWWTRNVRGLILEWIVPLQDYFERWPKFSGDRLFPIPSTIPDRAPSAMFYFSHNKWEGEYGSLRKELTLFIIKCIEEEIESE